MVQLPIGEALNLVSVELHLLHWSECKRNIPIPLISVLPSASPPKLKKKRMLMKLDDITLPPPPPTTASLTLSIALLTSAPSASGPPAPLSPHLATED